MARLYWRDVGLAAGCFLAISYAFCVAYDLAFDERMYRVWLGLLPGVTWISWRTFFLGLVWSFVYGLYFGLVFTPLYNFFREKSGGHAPGDAVRPKRK